MTMTNHYGMQFANEAEKQAWDDYVAAQLHAALQTPLLTAEEAAQRLDALLDELPRVSHTVA